jgi:hypothetical protein
MASDLTSYDSGFLWVRDPWKTMAGVACAIRMR